jgi:oxygen-independent coproporphyrinogen-3 oxidase
LLAEMRAHEWTELPDTLYLGGGTPSQMDTELLQEIFGAIPGGSLIEATMEAAPGTFSSEQVAAWREAGIDRVSLGVQSFVDGELRHTARKHDAARVADDCEMLRKAGIRNINLDLIAGLPGQTVESWNESLDWIERLDPPHVSVYLLEVDEDSRLGLEIIGEGSRYGARKVPSDDLMADLYEIAVERLGAMGIGRYEVSNFAREGFASRHNLKYWLREPYVGFGADAHSFDGVRRFENVESASEYVERWRAGASVRSGESVANGAEERFFVGLRLMKGIEPTEDEWRRFAQPIGRFVEQGLLDIEGKSLRLTGRGVLLSNEVFQEFLQS